MQDIQEWSNLAVASGTIVLAIGTGLLARQTKNVVDKAGEQVNATKEQADVAREQVAVSNVQAALAAQALAASVQPTLVAVPPLGETSASMASVGGVRPDRVAVDEPVDGIRQVTIPLRNIGPGVALIRGLSVRVGPDVGWSGRMSSGVVAINEVTRLWFDIPTDRPELAPLVAATTFTVIAAYTDISGERTFRTEAHVHRVGDDQRWIVRQVFLYRGDETEPFAATGPSEF